MRVDRRGTDRAERVANLLAAVRLLDEIGRRADRLERWIGHRDCSNMACSALTPAIGAIAVTHEHCRTTRAILYGTAKAPPCERHCLLLFGRHFDLHDE